MEVAVLFRRGCRSASAQRIRVMVRQVIARIPTAARQVAILLTNDAEMRAMNSRFRGFDRPTDVLSFPAGTGVAGAAGHLGDIAISVERAARQARKARWGTQEEIQFLVLHASGAGKPPRPEGVRPSARAGKSAGEGTEDASTRKRPECLKIRTRPSGRSSLRRPRLSDQALSRSSDARTWASPPS